MILKLAKLANKFLHEANKFESCRIEVTIFPKKNNQINEIPYHVEHISFSSLTATMNLNIKSHIFVYP